MRKLATIFASLLILSLVIGTIGCAGETVSTPTPTPTPTPNPASVLFKDDFSNESSGWDTFYDGNGSAFYQDGWLHVRNNTSSEYGSYSSSHQYFTDFVLVVETKLVDGSENNWHSVTARDDGAKNYYDFSISADGYYLVEKWVGGLRTKFRDPTKSIYIKQGKGVINIVRVECVGSNLSFSVNGHLLANVSDYTFTGGDIALGASALGSEFTEVAFDNITVTVP